jgi:hypothetical protein
MFLLFPFINGESSYNAPLSSVWLSMNARRANLGSGCAQERRHNHYTFIPSLPWLSSLQGVSGKSSWCPRLSRGKSIMRNNKPTGTVHHVSRIALTSLGTLLGWHYCSQLDRPARSRPHSPVTNLSPKDRGHKVQDENIKPRFQRPADPSNEQTAGCHVLDHTGDMAERSLRAQIRSSTMSVVSLARPPQ